MRATRIIALAAALVLLGGIGCGSVDSSGPGSGSGDDVIDDSGGSVDGGEDVDAGDVPPDVDEDAEDTEPDVEPDTEPDVEPDAPQDVDPDTSVDVDTDAMADSGDDADTEDPDVGSDTDSGGDPDTTTDPDTTVDTGPGPGECVDNRDCAGGEICFDEQCRAVCTGRDDCEEPWTGCNTDAGLCTECDGDDDCGDNERCFDGLCTFFCASRDDCPGDALCEPIDGSCFTPECEASDECLGGQVCAGSRCVDFEDVICEAGMSDCDGNTAVRCSGDGTTEEREPCGDDEACVVGDDGATCLAVVCESGEVGCADDFTAYACDATGTMLESLPCRDGQYCNDAACLPQTCTPDESTCDGDVIVACDSRGAEATRTRCRSTVDCQLSEFGCRCVDGDPARCEELACEPGVRQCVGNGVRTCLDDGTGFTSVAECDDTELCIDGSCVDATCEPNSVSCEDGVLIECDSRGVTVDATDCATFDGVCDDRFVDVPRCRQVVCEPGSTSCGGSAVGGPEVLTCNALGTGSTSTPCDTTYCVEGECTEQLCEADTTFCRDGDVYRCNGTGDATSRVDTCVGAEVCEDAACTCPDTALSCGGSCIDPETDPNNCGSCGNVCMGFPFFGTCEGGECVCPFDGETYCDGICVNTDSSQSNCGSCGNACGPGEVCDGGRCGCPDDFSICDGSCVDTLFDEENCGGCGVACGAEQVCDGGSCVTPTCECAPGDEVCAPGMGMCPADADFCCGFAGFSCLFVTTICE